MRNGRIIAIIFTIVLCLFISIIIFMGINSDTDEQIVFLVQSEGTVEKIKCWEDNNGKIYVFLPTYTNMNNVNIHIPLNANLYINDVMIKRGMSCSQFLLDVEYDLSGDLINENVNGKIVFVQSGKVPTMYIDTQSGSMDFIHEEKGNEEAGLIRLYTADGELDYKGDVESLKGRGNSTWEAPKKPYGLKLSSEADLLDMGAAQRWILLANARDSSHLSNKIAYDMAKNLGMEYSPDCQWVDLYLNGEYAGLYLLTERNEVQENRVNISKTDGFLISNEAELVLYWKDCPTISTEKGSYMRVHHSSISLQDLTRMWQSVENALLSEDGIDPTTEKHWTELIDLDSWAMRFLLDEVMANCDGGFFSQFYYGSQADGKVYAGPVWDMDACLGQWGGYANQILAHREMLWFSPYYELYQKEEFYSRVTELFENVFLPRFTELLDEGFEQYAAIISQSAKMNQIRWDEKDFLENVEINRRFLEERLAFLKDYWLDDGEYYDVHIVAGRYDWKFAVRAGECIPMSFDNYTDDWYIYEGKERIDITQPIYEDAYIWHGDAFYVLSQFKVLSPEQKIALIGAVAQEPEERFSIIRIAPIALMVMLMVLCYVVDIVRVKRDGIQRNDRKKH